MLSYLAGTYNWHAAFTFGQAAVRLESVLDSSLHPLRHLNQVDIRSPFFHKLVGIACSGGGGLATIGPSLQAAVLQDLTHIQAAAVPQGCSFNFFAVSHLAKHWQLPPAMLTETGVIHIPGMTPDAWPQIAGYFNAVKCYGDTLAQLQDTKSARGYGGRGRPHPQQMLARDCTLEFL